MTMQSLSPQTDDTQMGEGENSKEEDAVEESDKDRRITT